MSERKYECPSCSAVHTSSEWTETSIRISKEEEANRGISLPDTWSMDTADMGDSVWCPSCEVEQERSELEDQ